LKIKNRSFIKSSDIKKFQAELHGMKLDSDTLFGKTCKMERGMLEDGTILYFINGELTFIEQDKRIFPFLRAILRNFIHLPKVVVDMGAIPYIIKGADVMFPGIVSADPGIKKDDFVTIVDEKHDKPIAIGLALENGPDFSREKKGKGVKNVHYVGDKLWEFIKTVESK
jgi:PUA-domain protein